METRDSETAFTNTFHTHIYRRIIAARFQGFKRMQENILHPPFPLWPHRYVCRSGIIDAPFKREKEWKRPPSQWVYVSISFLRKPLKLSRFLAFGSINIDSYTYIYIYSVFTLFFSGFHRNRSAISFLGRQSSHLVDYWLATTDSLFVCIPPGSLLYLFLFLYLNKYTFRRVKNPNEDKLDQNVQAIFLNDNKIKSLDISEIFLWFLYRNSYSAK